MGLYYLILQLLLAHFAFAKSYTKSKDAVLLSKVRSLTLQSGKQTTARRVEPITQLTCVGGNAKGHYDVDIMRCKNSGSEYDPEDIQWTCQANLPPEFKLGSTEVVCEGFDSSDDPYVLKGSCGVEYRLVLTPVGEEKYGKGGWFTNRGNAFDSSEQSLPSKSFGSRLYSIIFWAAFIGIVVLILYSIAQQQGPNRQPRMPRNPLGGGGGFWGGGGGDDDPPPPYTPRAPPRSKPSSSSSTPRSSRSSNSGPGFWSGTGLGAAGGYAAGQYMANRTRDQERARQQNAFGTGPSNYRQGGSSWFGGGGGSPAAGPSTAPSSSRYESTGFGSTRRR